MPSSSNTDANIVTQQERCTRGPNIWIPGPKLGSSNAVLLAIVVMVVMVFVVVMLVVDPIILN
jgi:hypothetical protein